MIKQSIIISYKEGNKDRKTNLQRILSYLSNLLDDETEIIIVEQDRSSKIDWLDSLSKKGQIHHIFLRNDGIFNKGWGYNVGVNNSNGNKLIFNDIDVYLPLKRYNFALNLLSKYEVVNPYNKIFFLDKSNSEKFIVNNHDFENIDTDSSYYLPNVISGGIFVMNKSKFMEIKGFDEECYGYGHEDDIFDMKLRIFRIPINIIPETAVHVYHQVFRNTDSYYSRQNINEILFNEYIRMSSRQLHIKINNIKSFGIIKNN